MSDQLTLEGSIETTPGIIAGSECRECNLTFPSDQLTKVRYHGPVCNNCVKGRNFGKCNVCSVFSFLGHRDRRCHPYSTCRNCRGIGHGGSECSTRDTDFAITSQNNGLFYSDELRRVEVKDNELPREGVSRVREYLSAVTGNCPPAESFDWSLSNEQGKLLRRISKYMHEEQKVKLSPSRLADIGGIISRNSLSFESINIEFTRHLNRESYEFYNDGSCWWGEFAKSRCVMKANGGIGMLLYNTSKKPEVMGRSWLLPVKVAETGRLVITASTDEAAGYIVFNGYGYQTWVHAHLLSKILGYKYRKFSYSNSGDRLYVNNGGSSTYMVGSDDLLIALEKWGNCFNIALYSDCNCEP